MVDGWESDARFSLVEHPMSPARILEIISPAGFERYFAELVELGGSRNALPDALRSLGERYGVEVEPQSIPGLLERFGRIGEPI
jgi:hypothetical protein